MKRFFCLVAACVLAAIAIPALAQTVPLNEGQYRCSPMAGKQIQWKLNLAQSGGWMSWWCLGGDQKWHLQLMAQPALDMVALADGYSNVLNAADYRTAMDAFTAANPAAARLATDPAVKPIWIDSIAAIEATKPADPAQPPPVTTPKVWKVADNGSLGGVPRKTRPAYKVVNGLRGAQSGSAIVGDTCRPEMAVIVEGGDRYMPFGAAPLPTLVTLCTSTPP